MNKQQTDARLKVRIQVKVPSVPNFILTEDGRSIDIKDLPDSTIREIGRRWTDKLLDHAWKRRG